MTVKQVIELDESEKELISKANKILVEVCFNCCDCENCPFRKKTDGVNCDLSMAEDVLNLILEGITTT